MVQEVADLYRPAAEVKAIEFTVDAPDGLTANGDPFLLAQAVGNLVDNAIKYAPADGKISLHLSRRDDGNVEISVVTTVRVSRLREGAGVTERFYRGDSSRGKVGVGLGLSVVASVAKLHGGMVAFADQSPRADSLAAAAHAGLTSQAGLTRKHRFYVQSDTDRLMGAEALSGKPDSLQIAIAVLLVLAARMDDHFDQAERCTTNAFSPNASRPARRSHSSADEGGRTCRKFEPDVSLHPSRGRTIGSSRTN